MPSPPLLERTFHVLNKKAILSVACVVCLCCVLYQFLPGRKAKIDNQIAKPIVHRSTQKSDTHDANNMHTTTDDQADTRQRDRVEELLPDLKLPALEDLPSLEKWASLNYITTAPGELNIEELDNRIKRIPVEIHTENTTEQDIAFARDAIKGIVQCYSDNEFTDWLVLRGGEESLATIDESEYVKRKYHDFWQRLKTALPDAPEPTSMLEVYSLMWNTVYSTWPYMDRVSFDLSFIAVYEQDQSEYEAEKWAPDSRIPNALQEEAVKRGSLRRGYMYRGWENKVPPNVVIQRDKKIKFIDVLITTGREKKTPYPIMFRYYYEPQSQKWLTAFAAEFYQEREEGTPFYNEPDKARLLLY